MAHVASVILIPSRNGSSNLTIDHKVEYSIRYPWQLAIKADELVQKSQV
jgi:hypothetical protein